MSKKVIWSARALNDYKNILHYINDTWSSKELVKFVDLVTKNIENIKSNTEIGMASKKKNVRKYILSRQTSIYYRTKGDNIFIITLADNRQAPGKLKI